ncbi:MAG: HlyD family efflux transporter periplasmic adaptor subunit [Chlamydiia bacterium]|nr:HlyD family efflux transporter periplasmic adaptor subunit [Chlamydiia bacterium]
MVNIHQVCKKAFESPTKKSLSYVILNESIQGIRYDRAMLWEFHGTHSELLGVSGHPTFDRKSELAKAWQNLVDQLRDPSELCKLEPEVFQDGGEGWRHYQDEQPSVGYWLPIQKDEKLFLGLWIETFDVQEVPKQSESIKFASQFLLPCYASAWARFTGAAWDQVKLKARSKIVQASIIAFILFLLLARVPLRIVAPCEVVARDPIYITAPLDGTVASVSVHPGQEVKEGDALFLYDDRLTLRQLGISKKEVEIYEEELRRASTQGLNDPTSLAQLGELNLQLEKEKINLRYTEWQASQMKQMAPQSGVVFMENPDQWRGKPVSAGEQIMTLNNPLATKLKIWIPEDDNINFDTLKGLKVFLNTAPTQSVPAKLVYVANESALSDLQVPSFLAEASWADEVQDVRIGVRGSAIIYGDTVSLGYFLFRKPIGFIRRSLGI